MAGYNSYGPCAAFLARAQVAPKAPKAPKESLKPIPFAPALGALGGLGEANTPVPDSAEHEERAAIIEVDGKVPRPWAEALARLDPSFPPAGVSAERWLLFIDDCGRFLDAGWAERALQIGWGPVELLGCDRLRPSMGEPGGLLWQLSGAKLIALSEDFAIAISIHGSKLKFRRTKNDMSLTPLWEVMSEGDLCSYSPKR